MLLWIVMDRDLYCDDRKTGVVMYDSLERTETNHQTPHNYSRIDQMFFSLSLSKAGGLEKGLSQYYLSLE